MIKKINQILDKKDRIVNRLSNHRGIAITASLLGFFLLALIVPLILFKGAPHLNDKIALDNVTVDTKPLPFDNLKITGAGAVVYDPGSNAFIYSKNGKAQLPLASITKVMSSVSALRIAERLDEEQTIKFAGNWWNLKDLMKYALVSSSNAGIASIAEAIEKIDGKDGGRGVSDKNILFTTEMNDIAGELQLDQTYFLNETGLDVNEKLAGAYSSAENTAKMFAYAISKYPNIFGVTKYPEFKVKTKDGAEKTSKNTNIDVNKMTTLIASKTGTTDLAGGNLVIAFDAGLSRPIIIAVFGSTPEDRFTDVEKLADAAVEYLSK